MKKEIFKKSIFARILSGISPVLLTAAVAVMIFYGLYQTEQSSKAEGLRVLDEGLRRATVKCYAVEGNYPGTVNYIEKNYGIYVDRSKYIVDYEIFASNIMPSIKVIELRR